MKFPWDPPEALPTPVEVPEPPSVVDTVQALQRDFAYAVRYTAVRVHSQHDELCITVNTPRGQIIPRGVCTFSDGSTTEFVDMGMPQIGVQTVESITDLIVMTWDAAEQLGLTL